MKALLVIDVEEDMIGEVDYTVLTKGNMCNGRAELKPMPQKLHESRPMYGENKNIVIGTRIDEYSKGWNACIDEILGGTE